MYIRTQESIMILQIIWFIFQVNKEKVVFFIQHYLKLLKYYGDQEILEACGRLDTNSFELKITTPDGVAKNLRAMYR